MKKGHKKYIFLDIDGTLVNMKGITPRSTFEALTAAQANGHEIFINTGRNIRAVYDHLLDFDFDGYICGTGAYVKYKNRVIFSEYISDKSLKLICNTLNQYNTPFMLATNQGTVIPDYHALYLVKHFSKGKINNMKEFEESDDPFIKSLEPYIFDSDVESFWKKYDTCTGVNYVDCKITCDDLSSMLDDSIRVMMASYKLSDPYSGEITLNKNSKSKMIDKVLSHIGASREDSIGIGDGFNDIEMLKFCNLGIAMGNSVDEVKEVSNYITTKIDEDGIMNAFKHYNLI